MQNSRKLLLGILWFFLIIMVIVAVLLFVWVAREALGDRSAVSETKEPEISPTPYIFQGETIQLAWFYRPPNDGNLLRLVENFDTFILTQQDVDERQELNALGMTRPIPQYFRMDAIMDPGGCNEKPWRNQVAYKEGDFCMISEQHPDWFLLDVSGNRIVEGSDIQFYFMDPGNPEWRTFFLTRVRESQETLGWVGVFLDNAEASFGKREKNGQMPGAYPDEASYISAIEGFLEYLYSGYFQPQGRPLYANIISVRDETIWYRYLNYLHGAMEEAWAADWWDGYFSTDGWEEHMQRAEQSQFYGREVILVSQGDQSDFARQEFTFASYLLINHGLASFRYAHHSAYNQPWLYGNYYLELGEPLGARYQVGDEWHRDFTNGTVIVNPLTHTSKIVTP